jgi:hypothetical protein
MGLDMYLNGEKFYWTNWETPEKNLTEDGFKVKEKILRLGYWRKHPDLHGYIVQTFANGVDECQKIELSKDDLLKILNAVKGESLPKTSGFFFGATDKADEQNTIGQIEKALKWAEEKEEGVSRSVYYEASW